MKTSELKKSVDGYGFKLVFISDWVDFIDADDVKRGYVSARYPNVFCVFDSCPKHIAQLILDYAYTPLEEREEEKKYWLKLPKQFKVTEHNYLRRIKIVTLYKNTFDYGYMFVDEPDEKAEFTQQEIDAIPFDTNFFIKEEVK